MKLSGKSRLGKAIIIELSAWRERAAQNENVPRGRVLKDEAIYEIAKHAPRSLDALSRLRTVRDSVKARGEAILRCVAAALAHDPADIAIPEAHAELPASASATVELLRVLLKAVSAELNIAPKLLASARRSRKARAIRRRRHPGACAAGGGSFSAKRRWRSRPDTLALGIKNKEIRLFPLEAALDPKVPAARTTLTSRRSAERQV